MPSQSEPNREAVRAEYISRINRVLDHIETHLDEKLTLEDLAAVAHFSRFHFHRIFKSMVGETLSRFIQRSRVEKAARMLVGNPRLSVTEIALACGFGSSAAFARAFKDAHGMSASEWRATACAPAGGDANSLEEQAPGEDGPAKSNLGQTIGNLGKDSAPAIFHIDPRSGHQTWRLKMNLDDITIEVKELPAQTVAYIRHIGPYKGDSALFEGLFGRLFGWAGPRGLVRFPETQCLNVYHDDPEITDEEKLRLSVCLTVPEDTAVDGEVGKMTLPGGNYALAHFEIDVTQYEEAWQLVMGRWLPQSGFQCDDRPVFEQNLNNPDEHPEGKHIVNICVPVKPL